jgi:energy-coupling factor transport system substrate-specific component
MKQKPFFQINPRMFAATVLGAALFTLMSRFIMVPTPVEGVFFFPSFALLGLFATLFGPISGALISLSGMVVVGILLKHIVLSYTIASVICGFIYGLAIKYVRADEGKFSSGDIIAYNITQIIGNFTAWALAAPALEILFSQFGKELVFPMGDRVLRVILFQDIPVKETVFNGAMAALVDILSAEFIGTPLLFCYSMIRRRQLRGPLMESAAVARIPE